MQPLALPLDVAAVGEFAQHALERRPVGILGAERARDLARADLAGCSRMKARSSSREGREVRFIGRSLAVSVANDGDRKGPLRWIIRQLAWSCVALVAGGRARGWPARAPGRLDEALMCLAVPGEGRLALRGRACGAGRCVRRARRSARRPLRA
jgi:hypothetical protein